MMTASTLLFLFSGTSVSGSGAGMAQNGNPGANPREWAPTGKTAGPFYTRLNVGNWVVEVLSHLLSREHEHTWACTQYGSDMSSPFLAPWLQGLPTFSRQIPPHLNIIMSSNLLST